MVSMIIFFIMQFVNVVLSTLRQICTIKANKHIGAIMNVISYTFYSAVVKLLTEQELWFVCIVTAITNAIGFYLADWLFKKMQKDKLWRISATLKKGTGQAEKVIKDLNEYNIKFNLTEIDKAFIFDIFSKTQGESSLIKSVLEKYSIKYHVIEIDKRL